MKEIDIFKKKYSYATAPTIVEFIFDLFYLEKGEDKSILKTRTLQILKKLLELDILKVIEWTAKPELNGLNLTPEETIKHIDEIWFDGAEFPDFYAMVMFYSTEWYETKLRKLGLTDTTDWDWFIENKIGNLEKWIEDNRPINHTNHNNGS